MKSGSKFLFNTISALLLGGGIAVLPAQSQAANITLTDGSSLAKIDTSSPAGMYQWSINGLNQLNNQWFYFRNGASGPQSSIESGALSTTISQSGVNHLNVIYNHGSFGIEIDYTLTETGTGQARIDESIRLRNLSGSTLNLYFFQYSDFNLSGTPGGDTLIMDAQNAIQQEGTSAIAEGILDPNATRFEANTTGGIGSTLYRLNNVSGLALNNVDNAAGDVTWAYEWNFQIGAGETQDILKNKGLTITLIPEPSSMAILITGLAAWALARRRQTP